MPTHPTTGSSASRSGDQLGKDAATGFLVTAAALLPGQIGADDASKRLARQDELSEIIVNTGQTFLGLTIGCTAATTINSTRSPRVIITPFRVSSPASITATAPCLPAKVPPPAA